MNFKLEHLSASQINQFLRCQLQWKFRKVDNLVIAPNSAVIKGSAVHKGLEYIYTEKKAFKSYYKDTAQDIAIDLIDKSDITDKNDLKDGTARLIDVYINQEIPETVKDENIQGVEHYIEIDIKGVHLIGYIDLLEYNKITDYKTTTKTPSNISLDYKIQSEIYSKATSIPDVSFQYLIDKKTPDISIKDYKAVNNELLNELVINTHNMMKNAIKTGDFMPNGLSSQWACNYCGYGESGICKYYKFNK
jgi:hypothetical protein